MSTKNWWCCSALKPVQLIQNSLCSIFLACKSGFFMAKLFLVVRCFLLYDASYLIMTLSSSVPDMVDSRESWVADFYLLICFAVIFQIYFFDTLSISLPEMRDSLGSLVVDDFLRSPVLWSFRCFFLWYQAVFFNRSVWIRRTLTFGRLKCCKLRSVMFYFCHFARWFFRFSCSFFLMWYFFTLIWLSQVFNQGFVMQDNFDI